MYVGEKVMGTIRILLKDTKNYVHTVLEVIKYLLPYANNEYKMD